jgi:MFS family permease
VSALRVPAFRRLWVAGLVSETGDWLLLITLPVLVYQLTGSVLGTGVAFLVEMVPPMLLAPLAGRVADHADRRRTLTLVPLAQTLALVPLAVSHALIVIYGVLAVESALTSIFEPAKNALLPTLVGPDRLVSANSLIGLSQNLGRLVGAPAGGLLLAVGGTRTVVAVDAASFLGAAVLIAGVHAVAAAGVAGSPATRPGRAAAGRAARGRAARGRAAGPRRAPRPGIRGALVVTGLVNAAQGLFVVLFVVFVARALHGGAAETGLLRGVQAVGALLGGLLLAGSPRLLARTRPARGHLSAGGLAAGGALALGLISLVIWNAPRLTTTVPLYVALFIVAGIPGMALVTGLVSWLQESRPDGQRGRAFASYGAVGAAGQALGALAGGIFGDRFSVITVLNGQAVIYLLAGALALAVLRPAGAPGQTGRPVTPPAAMIRCPPPARLGSRRTGNIDSGRTGF